MSQPIPKAKGFDLDQFVASGETTSSATGSTQPSTHDTLREEEITRNLASMYPWMSPDVSSDRKHSCSVRIPENEYLMLKWLGETTYGENFQSLMVMGAREIIKRMMRERNLRVHEDRKTGQLSIDIKK